VAESETHDRAGALRSRRVVALPFVVYLLLLAVAVLAVPYRPALDDAELRFLAAHWAEHGRLDARAELFLRVPLWQMMLGSAYAVLGERAGLVAVQVAVVLGALWVYARRCERRGLPERSALVAAVIFAVSPQIVLYSRHTVNELFVGLIAMGVVAIGERVDARRALALGALTGAAAMTKVAALVVALPAALYLWRARDRLPLRRSAPRFAGGFAAVAIPLAALAAWQRGTWLLDDTSAFNLSALDQTQWMALGDPLARQRAGLASFRESLGADPAGYLIAAGGRAVDWLLRPGSLDILHWMEGYPPLLVEAADVIAFFAIATLAVLGTTRATAPAWLFPVAMWAACSLPQKTPYSPRIAVLFPLLLLAPRGLETLRALGAARRAGSGS